MTSNIYASMVLGPVVRDTMIHKILQEEKICPCTSRDIWRENGKLEHLFERWKQPYERLNNGPIYTVKPPFGKLKSSSPSKFAKFFCREILLFYSTCFSYTKNWTFSLTFHGFNTILSLIPGLLKVLILILKLWTTDLNTVAPSTAFGP